jgi:hypothetical protein
MSQASSYGTSLASSTGLSSVWVRWETGGMAQLTQYSAFVWCNNNDPSIELGSLPQDTVWITFHDASTAPYRNVVYCNYFNPGTYYMRMLLITGSNQRAVSIVPVTIIP